MDGIRKFIVIVEVDKEQCFWLGDEVVKVGTIATETSDMYGCCGPDGIMVSYEGMRGTGCELPKTALAPFVDESIPEVDLSHLN